MLWTLPGPNRFVQSLVDRLRDGLFTIVLVPDWLDAATLRQQVSDRWDVWRRQPIRRVTVSTWTDQPAFGPQLCHHLGIEGDLTSNRTSFEQLRSDRSLRDQVIWIEGIEYLHAEMQRNCLAYLRRFARDCKDLSRDRYPRMVVVLRGGSVIELPVGQEAKLDVLPWWDALSRNEMNLLADQLAGHLPPYERDVLVELSGPNLRRFERLRGLPAIDPEAARALLSVGGPLDPGIESAFHSLLEERADLWDPDVADPMLKGLIECYRGEAPRLSSETLARMGDVGALAKRQWESQVGFLLPRIDFWRHEVITVMDRLFARRPWYGQIKDHQGNPFVSSVDVEIGSIYWYLGMPERYGRYPELQDFVSWLRDRRNDLAHLRPVSSTEVAAGADLHQTFRREYATLLEGAFMPRVMPSAGGAQRLAIRHQG